MFNLGNLSTGGTQLLGNIVSGHLYSEPGFEPQFSGAVRHAGDYLTQDPTTSAGPGLARPACIGEIVPDDDDTPFLFRISGIDTASQQATAIFLDPSAQGRAVPYGYSYSSKLLYNGAVITL